MIFRGWQDWYPFKRTGERLRREQECWRLYEASQKLLDKMHDRSYKGLNTKELSLEIDRLTFTKKMIDELYPAMKNRDLDGLRRVHDSLDTYLQNEVMQKLSSNLD
jgi:hypothetical protein